MTIKEAHKAWGGKADHLLTYHHTKDIFGEGFKALDLNKPLNSYGINELARALKQSELSQENMYLAASVMCSVLKEYGGIYFTAKDIMEASPQAQPHPQPLSEARGALNDQTTKQLNDQLTMKSQTTKQPNDQSPKRPTKKAFRPTSMKVRQIDPQTGNEVDTYDSIADAQRMAKVKNIGRAIRNGGTAGGYKWEPVNGNARSINNEQLIIDNDNPKPSAIRHQTSLTDIPDQDLIRELKRRGWKGNLEVVTRVEL